MLSRVYIACLCIICSMYMYIHVGQVQPTQYGIPKNDTRLETMCLHHLLDVLYQRLARENTALTIRLRLVLLCRLYDCRERFVGGHD